MYDIGYIEKYGYGIKMMKEECEKHPLVALEFNVRPYITEIIFKKIRKEHILDPIDKEIFRALREKQELSSGELAEIIGKTKPTIIKHLKKLIKLGIVEEKGRGPAKRYRLKLF